jgi:hypothetical protein
LAWFAVRLRGGDGIQSPPLTDQFLSDDLIRQLKELPRAAAAH